jgi:hypothetical protein
MTALSHATQPQEPYPTVQPRHHLTVPAPLEATRGKS